MHPDPPAKPDRVASVDALRGFSIFWLVGGEGAALALAEMMQHDGAAFRAVGGFIRHQFEHAQWEGMRFWDFVFPLLLFVVGVSIALSFPKHLAAQHGRRELYRRVVTRAVLLFALGILFNGGFSKPWPDVRLMGILQRIALCYLAASLLFMHLRWRGLAAVTAMILVGYWALLTFVPVPGLGVATYQVDVNLANWIDRNYLPGRKFDGLTDPEGLLSTLPAVATCLLGVLAGIVLHDERVPPLRKVWALFIGGFVLTAAGYLWGLQFPIIKAIWTSSYVLVTAGYSAMLLGAVYAIMDVAGRRRWATIFKWIGVNALALYFFNGVAGFEPFARRLTGGSISQFLDRAIAPGTGRFVTHVVALTIVIALAAYLYRRRIFIRV